MLSCKQSKDQNNQSMSRSPSDLGIHVLVVEDNLINREVAIGLLESMGCTAEFADNGKDALDLFQTDQGFDLILMDLQMPVMDGFETTKAIRQLESAHKFKPIPIIAVTANALLETRTACEEAGMNGFVTKPIYAEKLKQAILDGLGTSGVN